MSAVSKIQWTDRTWNPVRGCSVVSAGCTNCYAMRQAHRFSGVGQSYEGLTRLAERGPVWTGKIRLVPEALEEPLHWRKPCRVFVNSMGDLFLETVPEHFIDRIFTVMALAGWHTFQVLTKRPERMRDYMTRLSKSIKPLETAARTLGYTFKFNCLDGRKHSMLPWPIPNIWLGVTTENQETADERIPILLQTPVAVRFLSVEPLLGPVDLGKWHEEGFHQNYLKPVPTDPVIPAIDWVIVGGESGLGARPCNVEWIRSIVKQCKTVGVPCFVKQLGSKINYSENGWCQLNDRKGGDPGEWPEDLRMREFPV